MPNSSLSSVLQTIRLQHAYRHNGIEEGRLKKCMLVIEKEHKYDTVTLAHDVAMTKRTLQFINECSGWSPEAEAVRKEEEAIEAKKALRAQRIKSAPESRTTPNCQGQRPSTCQGQGRVLGKRSNSGDISRRVQSSKHGQRSRKDFHQFQREFPKIEHHDIIKQKSNDVTDGNDLLSDDESESDVTVSDLSDSISHYTSNSGFIKARQRPKTVSFTESDFQNKRVLQLHPGKSRRRPSSDIEKSMIAGMAGFGINKPHPQPNVKYVAFQNTTFTEKQQRQLLKDIDTDRHKAIQKKLDQFRSLYPL